MIKKEIHEIWYFKNALQRDKREICKAIGFELKEDNKIKEKQGETSEYYWKITKTVVRNADRR